MSDQNEGPDLDPSEADGYDPVVAERFELLNNVTVPDPVMVDRSPVLAASPPQSGRPGFVLATAAAAAVVVVGLTTFAISRDGGNGIDVAGELPVISSGTDGGGAVEDDGADTDGAVDNGAEDDGAEAVVVTTTPTATALDVSKTEDDGDNGTGDPDDSSGSPATTEQKPDTTEERSETETTPKTTIPESQGQQVVIRGTVTEVMLDCHSHLILNDAGEVVEAGRVTCDGGNFIVVDGRRISTSSGFVPAELAFNKHPDWLKPGLTVSVTATQEDGWLHLNCDVCQVRMG